MKLEKFSDDVTIHFKENGIEYLKFRALEKYNDKVEHLITLRHGGKSEFPVDTLNFRTIGNDKKENVIYNLEKTLKNMSIDKNNVYIASQHHTDDVLVLDSSNKEKYQFENYNGEFYDAYVTDQKNIATLVRTADCNPIIVYDTKNNVYANIHSGWKGTIKRVYIRAIEKLQENYGSNLEELIVCIGPSIRKCCFSSEEEEFLEKFKEVFDEKMDYVQYEENGKRFHIDLIKIITTDLINLGIKKENINVANICTCCNHEDFFSFRYATMEKYDDYGLMATLVNLK